MLKQLCVRDRDGKDYANFRTGTRVPVQNLDGYPGSFLKKIDSPNNNKAKYEMNGKCLEEVVDERDLAEL